MQPTVAEEQIGVQGFVSSCAWFLGGITRATINFVDYPRNGPPMVMNAYSRAQTYMVYYVDRH